MMKKVKRCYCNFIYDTLKNETVITKMLVDQARTILERCSQENPSPPIDSI